MVLLFSIDSFRCPKLMEDDACIRGRARTCLDFVLTPAIAASIGLMTLYSGVFSSSAAAEIGGKAGVVGI